MDSIRVLKRLGLYRQAKSVQQMRLRPKRLAFYSQFIKKGDLCFDIGANIGNRTDVFLRLGARVVAVEPQDEPFHLLERRYGNNRNLTAIKAGLASKKGTAELFICYSDSLSSMSPEWINRVRESHRFPKHYEWNSKVMVPVETLDYLIGLYGLPRFCKIDVEGYELEVVRGLSTPIPMLSFEFASETVEIPLAVIGDLERLTAYEYNYDVGEVAKFASVDWLTVDKITQYLVGARKDRVFGDIYARLVNRP